MTAAIGEGDLRPGDRVADGARHEDPAGPGQRRDLGRPADADAGDLGADPLNLTHMDAEPRGQAKPGRLAFIHGYDAFALA